MFVCVVPACRQEFKLAHMARFLVCDHHLANMLDEHRSYNQTPHSCVWPLNGEVLSSRLENHMLEANRRRVELPFNGKRQFSVGVHVVLVVLRLADAGRNGRVVRHLLS